MQDRIRFISNRIKEHLWVKPLLICIFSIIAAFVAKLADRIEFLQFVPSVSLESLNIFLSISSGSMLGVATFAVGSMLTAYASASNTATPRSFRLVIADDVSQNALSSFIGAFIFSIVALVALENGYYGQAGRFILFILSIIVFAIIIFNFIRWIDRIARLGRLGNTIKKVETVAEESLLRRKQKPTLGAMKAVGHHTGVPIYGKSIGYVQFIDIPILQYIAEEQDLQITVSSLPGAFTYPDQPMAYVDANGNLHKAEIDSKGIAEAFTIAKDRAFDEDPRFGLVVLSEIASRALSAAVNDPGTAIDIIGRMIRLFALWVSADEGDLDVKYDRVAVPELSMRDMFDDAFNPIARDGAGTIEVVVRLQKAFRSLASLGHQEMRQEAIDHAKLAFRYAENGLGLEDEMAILNRVHQSLFNQ